MTVQQSTADDESAEVKNWIDTHLEAIDHNPLTCEVLYNSVLNSGDVGVTITSRSDDKLVLDFDGDVDGLGVNGDAAAAQGAVLTTPSE